jgi:hypothetical protein
VDVPPDRLAAWNCRAPRVVRFWSATSGTHEAAIEALRLRSPIEVVEPSAEELRVQLAVELDSAKDHLRAIVDRYWDRDWRDDNRGYTTPEDQLWRAAAAVSELEAALSSPAG